MARYVYTDRHGLGRELEAGSLAEARELVVVLERDGGARLPVRDRCASSVRPADAEARAEFGERVG